jgi:glycine/D-amino acid oxidase-like deaminating enzyme
MHGSLRRSAGPPRPVFALWEAATLAFGHPSKPKDSAPSLDVVIIEQDICGGGPSGRNSGMLLSAWPKAMTRSVKRRGHNGLSARRRLAIAYHARQSGGLVHFRSMAW